VILGFAILGVAFCGFKVSFRLPGGGVWEGERGRNRTRYWGKYSKLRGRSSINLEKNT
jgi:hypothetical protein